MTDLFVTEVGSRMWGMEKPDSDYDMFHVFAQPSDDYLRRSSFDTTHPHKTFFEDGKEIDAQFMEIGHLIGLLKKGNVNAIWAVCSPVVHIESGYRSLLKKLVQENLSSATYASVNGMAHSQMNDTKKRATVRDPEKSRNTAARTLQFGITLLNKHILRFEPVSDSTPSEVGELFRVMEDARDKTSLPDSVDRAPFEEFIFELRMAEIIGNHPNIRIK